jgi:hypothetical protein
MFVAQNWTGENLPEAMLVPACISLTLISCEEKKKSCMPSTTSPLRFSPWSHVRRVKENPSATSKPTVKNVANAKSNRNPLSSENP